MTVREFIKILEKYDPETQVLMRQREEDDDARGFWFHPGVEEEIEEVYLNIRESEDLVGPHEQKEVLLPEEEEIAQGMQAVKGIVL